MPFGDASARVEDTSGHSSMGSMMQACDYVYVEQTILLV